MSSSGTLRAEGEPEPDLASNLECDPEPDLEPDLETGPGMILGHSGEGIGPGSNRSEPNQFYSLHPGRGANFLFVDGHVEFLKASMNYKSYLALSTRNRGEVISGDY